MKYVSTFPLRNFWFSSTFRRNGMFVFTPRTRNSRRARFIFAQDDCKSPAWAITWEHERDFNEYLWCSSVRYDRVFWLRKEQQTEQQVCFRIYLFSIIICIDLYLDEKRIVVRRDNCTSECGRAIQPDTHTFSRTEYFDSSGIRLKVLRRIFRRDTTLYRETLWSDLVLSHT